MSASKQKLSLSAVSLLMVPVILWSGNAVVGRMVADYVPPMLFNLLRWVLAALILLPLAVWVFQPGSGLWQQRRRYAMLGLLSIGAYNAMQYLALKTTSPINTTLVGASMPIWMQIIGRVFFHESISRRQLAGSLVSITGVLLVLTRGNVETLLHLQLLPGDFYMIIATICWAFYSWMLAHPRGESPEVRGDWAAFLFAQIVYGLGWSALFAGGEQFVGVPPVAWSWPLVAALIFVAIGPAVLAYRAWGLGVQRVGPTIASSFMNLIPLLTALLSTALLGELPQLFHGAAFVLIVGGIVIASRR